TLLINGTNAKEEVVLGHSLHSESLHVAHGLRMGPGCFGRIAPDNFVTCQIRFLVPVPLDGSIVRQARRKRYIFWPRRSQCQTRERRSIHPSDVRDVIKVIKLRQVAVLNSILYADVLMLMLIILVRLGEAYRGITTLKEW